jgi:hypothetical protein
MTWCDKLIISYLYLPFDASKGYDKLNLFLILSCYSFVIFIPSLGWVKNYYDRIANLFLILSSSFICLSTLNSRHLYAHRPSPTPSSHRTSSIADILFSLRLLHCLQPLVFSLLLFNLWSNFNHLMLQAFSI